jgi:arabinose-5-phosphate isomerase
MTDASVELLNIARDVLQRESQAILDLVPRLDERFIQAVEMILSCEGKVIVTAVGKSGHIGGKIAATLSSTGTPAFFIHPTEALHGDLGMIRKRDIVIAISHSGGTSELLAVIPVIQKIGAPVIAICHSAQTPLGVAASCCLETNVSKEADTLNLAPTASTTTVLALGDALAVALLRKRGFKMEDFAFLHPGGSLGHSLQRVRDIIEGGKNPCVQEATTVQEAIVASKEANLGAVSIVGDGGVLLGIFTDGDIGRVLRKNRGERLLAVLEGPVSEVMTAKPMSIHADTLGEKTVHLMEEQATYVLPVLERDGRVIGMLRMHDLVRAGYTIQTNGE